MDAAFEEIYAARIRSRTIERYYIETVNMLESIQRDLGVRIRPDAVHFLASNVDEMVAKPIAEARDRTVTLETAKLVSDDELLSRIYEDMRLIVSSAVEVSRSREREVISSTSIIIALGQRILELNLNDLQIWG